MGIIILIVLIIALVEFCGVFRNIIEQIKIEMWEQEYTPTESKEYTPQVVDRPKPTINLSIEDIPKEIEKQPNKPKSTINLFIEQ